MDKIIIYTSSNCKYCKMLKEYLNKNNISFEERNIDTNLEYKKFLFKNKILGVPVTFIGKEKVIGFNKEKIDRILINR